MHNAMFNRVKEFWPSYENVNESGDGRHYATLSLNKKCYRCCFEFSEVEEFNMDKKIKRCHYNSPDMEAFIKHKCIFTLTVPNDYTLPIDVIKKNKSFDISDDASGVAAELNISIRSMASPVMIHFINSIYTEGFNQGMQNRSLSIKQPKITISQRRIRENMIKRKEKYINYTNESINNCLFFSCTFDAGTVFTRHELMWCAASPAELPRHLFLGTLTMLKSWCADDYKDWAEKVSNAYGNLVAFVGDGLKSAINGIADFKKDGLCSKTFGTELIFSPCHSHIISNAFKKALLQSDYLGNITIITRNLAVLLNKNSVKGQNLIVPSIPETRWLYAFDVAKWIIKHEITINAIIMSGNDKIKAKLRSKQFEQFKNGVPELVHDFVKAARPIKELQLEIEKDSTSIALVYPLLMRTIVSFNNIINTANKKTIEDMAKTIKKSLIKEFKEKARIPLLIASFSLTPLGIKYIKHTKIEDLFNGDCLLIDDDMEDPETIFEYDEEDTAEPIDRPEEIISINKDEECNIEPDQDISNSGDNSSASITPDSECEDSDCDIIKTFKTIHATMKTRIHCFDDVNYEKNKIDLIYSPAEIKEISTKVLVKRKIISYARTHSCGTDKEKEKLCAIINKITQLLKEFYDNTEKYKAEQGDITVSSPGTYGYSFWKSIYEKKDKPMKYIAEQALQLMSIAAGESDCERAISRTRSLSDPRRGKEKDDLATARIICGIMESERRSKVERVLKKNEYTPEKKEKKL